MIRFLVLAFSLQFLPGLYAEQSPVKIVLVAGEMTQKDIPGKHDYEGGCRILEKVLSQTKGVQTSLILNGWPENSESFEQADSIVFYTDGGGKQPCLKTPERVALIDRLMKKGVGLVQFHQTVDYPVQFTQIAASWIGGTYIPGKSSRGHWPSKHGEFPVHEVTNGVSPWKVNDGWLNKIFFTENMKGVTPLIWSGKKYGGSSSGGKSEITGWTYEREGGGRSFCYSGLHEHDCWKIKGIRQLIVNGVLWSSGLKIPSSGSPNKLSDSEIDKLKTP